MYMRDLLQHLFLPHHSNNHRPKVLHIDALSVYVILLAFFYYGIQTIHKQYPQVLGYATDIYVGQLLALTNAKRQEAGLSPLTLNQQLSVAAAAKAKDMFAKNYWAHNSPDGLKPWDFITEAGYHYTVAGENLAKNFTNSQGVVDAWMDSESHKDNLLKNSYKDIGFAVVNGILEGEETTLIVQMFGTTPSELAALPPGRNIENSPQNSLPQEVKLPIVGAASAFTSVTQKPLVNIPTITRNIVLLFIGVLIGILAIDAWFILKRGTVRISGHNIAHILFFLMLLIVAGSVARGSIL